MVGVGLKDCSASLERGALLSLYPKDSKKVSKAVRGIRQDYKVVNVSTNYFDVEGTVTLMVGASSSDSPALVVECTYEAHIHAKPPFTRVQAERFSQSELRLLLVPYARQFISGVTSQMSIPPVVIPLAARFEDERFD